MASESLRQVFANAVTAIILRSKEVALFSEKRREFCRTIALGFDLTEYAGDEVYTYYTETPTADTIVGFGVGYSYENYENTIENILANYPSTSGLQVNQRRYFAAVVNAILFGYALNPNIPATELYDTIGETLLAAEDQLVGQTVFQTERINNHRHVIHPFDYGLIKQLLRQFDYPYVMQEVKVWSPKNTDVDLVHYNFYNTRPLFAGPDLNTMKDSENQYYYVSGQLVYTDMPTGVSFCEEQTVTLTRPDGSTEQITVFANTPCIDAESFTGPLTGNKFYRVFNDGPYSTGNYSDTVNSAFIGFDQSRLSGVDYSGNLNNLYNFIYDPISKTYGTIYDGGVQRDVEGIYNIGLEYSKHPMDTGCLAKYQVMRVGDGRIRSQCTKYDIGGVCIECKEIPATGFKFVNVALNEEIWQDQFAYVLTNPFTETSRVMIRGMNMTTNPYIGSVVGGEIITATPDGFGGYDWYIGPPQIGANELPFFGFTESFASNTFNQKASITLWPAIGSSAGGNQGDSDRSYEFSSRPIASGTDLGDYTISQTEIGIVPKANFTTLIPAYISGDDDVKNKVFGMGNAFSGKYIVTSTTEENAGYFYKDYVLQDSSGKVYSQSSLLSDWAPYKIGSPYKTVKFISGYTGYGATFQVNRIIGHNGSGQNIEYYYFDNRNLPNGLEIEQSGWTSFAPLPSNVEADSNYQRIYDEVRVENSYQRYYRGPYANYHENFLYPNAFRMNQIFDGGIGFPTKFKYKIRVREETVKELYAKYKISKGWVYDDTITFIPVVRTTGEIKNAATIMSTMFNAGGAQWDFNEWNIAKVGGYFYNSGYPNHVDNNWAPPAESYAVGGGPNPEIHYVQDSGKHNITFSDEPIFVQGVLMTGAATENTRPGYLEHKRYTGTNPLDYYWWYSPEPRRYGNYHGFTGFEVTGYLTYTYPLFKIEDGLVDRSSATGALPLECSGCTSYYFHPNSGPDTPSIAQGITHLYTKALNGEIFYSNSGEDPIYFKDMGGRRGGPTATGQGGYHPYGIIGDAWMAMNVKEFGYYCSNWTDVCDDGDFTNENQLNFSVNATTNDNRLPFYDKEYLFFNLSASKLDIYTRALNYNPMVYDRTDIPFQSTSNVLASNRKTASFTFDTTAQAFKFDLGKVFPLRNMTTFPSEWYFNPSGSGLVLGPFDRDVEFFLSTGVILAARNSLYINRRKITDLASGSNDNNDTCSAPKRLSGEYIGDFLNTKAIIYVPSGERAYINVKGIATGACNTGGSTPFGSAPYCMVGVPTKSYVHIRARTTVGERYLDLGAQSALGISGNLTWLHNFNFIKNGSERVFSIDAPSNGPLGLLGNVSTFTPFTRSGYMYPKPDASEFAKYRVSDKNGNGSYTIKDVQEFYIKKTQSEGNTVWVTGWREGSRVSFEIVEMTPVYDRPPYDSQNVIIPSGNCLLSGEMGYVGQADSAIFSEGFALEDITPNDYIRDNIYGPQYVSDVLRRVPVYTYPTGDYKHPVVDAPSMMLQRVDTLHITDDQDYSGINIDPSENYNKFLWPALSDLRTLNPEETLEEIPPADGNTFTNSTMLISAAQGQKLPNGRYNPNFKKVYAVREQYQMYDSVATDAFINSGLFMTSKRGTLTHLSQPESGYTVPQGTTLTEIVNDLV
jgi:hypothetical protein